MNLIKAIVNRVINYFNLDLHIKEVISGASVAFFLKACGAGLGFGFNVLLARLLGAEGAGIYYLALTVTTIATVVGRMGMDNTLLRFTAANASQEKWDKVAGVYKQGIFIAVIASTLVAFTVITGAKWIALNVFSEPDLIKPVMLMALAILPMSLLTLHAELLKALKRIRDTMLVKGVGISLISFLLLVILGGTFQVMGAVTAYVCASIIVLILSIVLWRRATPQLKGLRGNFNIRLLLTTSIPLFGVALMNIAMNWTDKFLLGLLTDSKSVGIYGSAMRTATLISFILVAFNSITAPKYAAFYAKGDFEGLQQVAQGSAKLMTVIALPVAAFFIIAPSFVLSIFGPTFKAGASVLAILSMGQLINVASGSVVYLLIMSGKERIVSRIISVTAILNVLLNYLLIPPLGIVGASIATASLVIITNIVLVWVVYQQLGVVSTVIPFRKRFYQ